jgi:hypothetical protein
MRQERGSWWRGLALGGLVGLLALGGAGQAAPGRAQVACEGEYDTFDTACVLGAPDAFGVTLRDALVRADQVRAYQFQVGPDVRTVHLYLGDLWYDMELALYRDPPDEAEIGRWPIARSAETGSRVIQFERPRIIVEDLQPATYTLFVAAGSGRAFDPRRQYTLRLALGPPACGTTVDTATIYQVALTVEPQSPTPSSLMSFNAFVSPPYSDLFNFEWQLDGQPMADAVHETLQVAASDLPAATGSEHRVRVTARGARPYPDPDPRYRQVPPTLSVECGFAGP